jgi:hypothetical protein
MIKHFRTGKVDVIYCLCFGSSDTPRIAKALAKSACEQKAFPLINKDVSWLWRTAYNCAVQGCSEWQECEEQIAELFAITKGVSAP